mgnify:CR=1 FL=1
MAQIEIDHLTFAYPPGDTPVLHDICLTVPESEFLVLCGPTGCGKSTLLRHIKRELRPHGKRGGVIAVAGVPVDDMDAAQSMRIGFVQQNPETQLVTDTVWHELAFALENLGLPNAVIRQRVAELASFFGIDGWFRKPVTELSGGQKQMLNLASVMAMQPKVLILDEPTSQLDPIAAREFLDTVRRINLELGTTVVLTEHRLEDAFPMADRVAVMEKGRIRFEGIPAEVGRMLSDEPGEGMFKGLPTPMRVYREVPFGDSCPLTVREGRLWLQALVRGAKPENAPEQDIPKAKDARAAVMETKDLWFRYSRDAEDVLRGLSVAFHPGETHCILGGNGSGKTTLLTLLAALKSPYRGRVTLNGKDVHKLPASALYRGNVALLPQNPRALFSKDSVKEELDAVAARMENADAARNRLFELISALGLEPLLSRHPYDLSGGEQQKTALAMMLLMAPRILLMDEPTKGLDADAKEGLGALLEGLKNQGMAIVMVTHDVEFAAVYADICSLLFDGVVTAQNPPGAFFAGNSFYTTAANRMARDVFPLAVTAKEVAQACKETLPAADQGSR